MFKKFFKKKQQRLNLVNDQKDIAIIGISCKFPGANDYEAFWRNLIEGKNNIVEITPDHYDISQYYSYDPNEKNKVISKWAGLLDDIKSFDEKFFNISSREADVMDPQQRILLQETWHCLEDAGILLHELQQAKTSVHVGVMSIDYLHHLSDTKHDISNYESLGNYEGILANRISYHFNLSGESQSLDAACASALMSVHNARRCLLAGESDYALAASVSVICHPWHFISFSKAHMLSPDGQCKPFDANANGYVPGEGVGVLLLCPLAKAIQKGHKIYGVIKGTATRHIGKNNSITAPRVNTQTEVIQAALNEANIDPESISYVEAHGTGTSLGDPIEVAALSEAFHHDTNKHCYIGSVKSNIGHLEASAGMAGIIKVLMMMKYHQIPKTLNVKTVNPIIDFANSPFQLPLENVAWEPSPITQKRQAGVSSFGFGGVTSHLILEEYLPDTTQALAKTDYHSLPFIISAKSETSLKALIAHWQQYIKGDRFSSESWSNVCFTLATGREAFPYRIGSKVSSQQDIIEFLNKTIPIYHSDEVSTSVIELRLGALTNISYAEFDLIIAQHPILQATKEECLNYIRNAKALEDNRIRQFIVCYTLGKALLISGLNPHVIICDNCANIVGLVLSGMLSLQDALAWLLNQNHQIKLKRPSIEFQSLSHQISIPPYFIDKSYCASIVANLKLDDVTIATIFEKSKNLIDNQFTFKKFLHEWDKVLLPININIETAILSPEKLNQTELEISLLILLVSFRRVNKKWDLKDSIHLNNPQYNDLIQMIIDQVITHQDALNLILNKNDDSYTKVAEVINLNNHKIIIDSYPFLKSLDTQLPEINNANNWLLSFMQPRIASNDNKLKSKSTKTIKLNGFFEHTITSYLTELWLSGFNIQWENWFEFSTYLKAALPNYPFDKYPHWIGDAQAEIKPTVHISPLIDTKNVLQDRQIFTKALSGDSFYLTDHRVKNIPTFPAAAYIELARAAAKSIHQTLDVVSLKNLVWMKAIQTENKPFPITISFTQSQFTSNFEVTSENNESQKNIYAQGKILYGEAVKSQAAIFDMPTIAAHCPNQKSPVEIYEYFNQLGLNYGPSFQVIREYCYNDHEGLSKLILPSSISSTANEYVLHPSLLDGALQSALLLLNDKTLYLPFSIGRIDVFAPIPAECYVYFNLSKSSTAISPTFQIQIYSSDGKPILSIQEFSVRGVAEKTEKTVVETSKVEIETSESLAGEALLVEVQKTIAKSLAQELGMSEDEINAEVELGTYGVDSVALTNLAIALEDYYQIELSPAVLFEYKTLKAFSNYLLEQYRDVLSKKHAVATTSEQTKQNEPALEEHTGVVTEAPVPKIMMLETEETLPDENEPIAIIGFTCRFPGAPNPEGLWQLLLQDKDAISIVPADRWDWQRFVNDSNPKLQAKWGGFIADIYAFDADFFNISPREAELMDPQQRMFLEATWELIESAGYTPNMITNCGVFAGVATNDYMIKVEKNENDSAYVPTGSFHSILSNRVSFEFNLCGPSETIDTACSSSLVAIHHAVNALHNGDCEVAIVGGTSALLSPSTFIEFSHAGMLSPDGHCKTFDESANGYVRGEGVGVIMLKPLSKARKDGDKIHGIIKGTAINHGGHVNSLTVPNPNAQAEVIIKAYDRARISIDSVSYIETHGTGTALGDPIEINGLKIAFQNLQQKQNIDSIPQASTGLGTIKTHIGHLEGAAGVAGVIKVLLSLRHKTLPGIANFKKLNPYIDIKNSPFYIANENREWKTSNNEPRRAGVSSFGFGGANAHVVIEEAVAINTQNPSKHKSDYFIKLSAKSANALQQKMQDLANWLMKHKDVTLEEVSYTLNARRVDFDKRAVYIASSIDELVQSLLSKPNAINTDKKIKYKDAALNESAKKLVSQLTPNDPQAYREQLNVLAQLYIDGAEIDWSLLHKEEQQHAIFLPTYPFQREVYICPNARLDVHTEAAKSMSSDPNQASSVVEPVAPVSISQQSGSSSISRSNAFYYQPVWDNQELKSISAIEAKTLLIFEEEGQTLAQQLRARFPDKRIIQVKNSFVFKKLDETNFEINYMLAKDYEQLVNQLTQLPNVIICHNGSRLGKPLTPDNYHIELNHHYFPIFYIAKSLMGKTLKEKLQLIYISTTPSLFAQSLSGILKTIQLEQPNILGKMIQMDLGSTLTADVIMREINNHDLEVQYVNGSRQVKYYQAKPAVNDHNQLLLRQKGVYLITGGAGGLGIIFARFLAQAYQAKIILIGRSPLKDASILESINRLGGETIYLASDVTNLDTLKPTIKTAEEKFGKINGVIHAAGVLRDAYITKKTIQQINEVFKAKILGTLCLEKVFEDSSLDFLMLCSSIVGALGNVGQCDYAYANAFLDNFARLPQRKWKTISLNWPLWAEGGMKIDKTSERWMERSLGVIPLQTNDGIAALLDSLADNISNQVVMVGNREKIESKLGVIKSMPPQRENQQNSAHETTADTVKTDHRLENKVQDKIIEIVAALIKVKKEKLDPEVSLSVYGMDSISFTELSFEVNDYYGLELTPAIFFDHGTLKDISNYLVQTHRQQMVAKHPLPQETEVPKSLQPSMPPQSPIPPKPIKQPEQQTVKREEKTAFATQKAQSSDIAIIGVAGVFPGAENLEIFWNNLITGKDAITEIPSTRWDWNNYLDKKNNAVKWGGFIKGIDEFDNKLFNISPREAEMMDPQQRIFLQTVWHALEDANYTPEKLAKHKTGIFVGESTFDYAEILAKGDIASAQSVTGTVHSVLANRISYILNLHGPSEVVDTACSSSLVALHHAVNAIKEGDCVLAIVGGVNALLTPTLYQSFTNAGMLSADGRCKTFDESANGYVRGEGAGAIILKPLNLAIADGDDVYAVIKGTAINHGGHVSALTVPNPSAQAEVIMDACNRANVDVNSINYVEAHGTGTSLGDPIEINGLKKAFASLAEQQGKPAQQNYCGLGSVKTNIGHLEAAAGIAGLIKVILSMRNQMLPGIMHFKKLNPYIELSASPFYVIEKSMLWPHVKDAQGAELPYRAGISSFGFGGANAHAILEEAPHIKQKEAASSKPYYCFTISAVTDESLQDKITQLKQYLKDKNSVSLAAISYTLNTCRTQFEKRCAIVVGSLDELEDALENISNGNVPSNAIMGLPEAAEAKVLFKEFAKYLLNELTLTKLSSTDYYDKLLALATLYVQGNTIDWDALYDDEAKVKIKLPLYPFAKYRYWAPIASQVRRKKNVNLLIDKNTSTLDSVSFGKTLRGDEFYLAQHKVASEAVLPGAAYIEMARTAAQLANKEQRVVGMRQIVWLKPIVYKNEKIHLRVSLTKLNNQVNFEIYSYPSHPIKHASGKIIYSAQPLASNQKLDLSSLQKSCLQSLDKTKIYQMFKSSGLEYGSSFKCITNYQYNENNALAQLQINDLHPKIALHPSVLDGIFQTTIAFLPTNQLFLPFSIDQIDIYQPLPDNVYVHTKLVSDAIDEAIKFDMSVYNEQGDLLLYIHHFVCKAIQRTEASKSVSTQIDVQVHEKPIPEIISEVPMAANNSLSDIVMRRITHIFATTLKMDVREIQPQKALSDYGLDSILMTELVMDIGDEYQIELSLTTMFDHKTIKSLVAYLLKNYQQALISKHKDELNTVPLSPIQHKSLEEASAKILNNSMEVRDEDIAIIGISGKFPQADNLSEFWQLLENKKDAITEIPSYRWDWKTYYGDGPEQSKAKFGGFISDIDEFDADFFNIPPEEAELIDPQHRLFMQTAWHAIEDAGYKPSDLADTTTGLFVGVSTMDYHQSSVQSESGNHHSVDNSHNMLTNRISAQLNLTGPSQPYNTACSSSLVALHHAISAIQNGDCELAIVGGVNALLNKVLFVQFYQAGMLSEDGRCKTFDKDANGYVRGEGVGAVLLKPLKKALADKDNIYCVIKGSAINHGGRVSSLTVPNPNAQTEVIVKANERANTDLNTITYIEAHGTGTPLGDPIEINGLKRAFESQSAPNHVGYCGIGTVKTNIGHLESAAGIASLMKVVLALKHEKLPGNLHLNTLNPHINLKNSPFYIVENTKDWARLKDDAGNEIPRRAGISSFGFGGANAHVVLEEARSKKVSPDSSKPYYLISLSAKTKNALQQLKKSLLKHLQENDVGLESLSFTLNVGRTDFNIRCAYVVESVEKFIEALDATLEKSDSKNYYERNDRSKPKESLSELYSKLRLANADKKAYEAILQKIAQYYVSGEMIDWIELHANESNHRIALPGYPFAKTKYWKTPAASLNQNHYYENRWKKIKLAEPHNDQSTLNGFIIGQASEWLTALQKSLSNQFEKLELMPINRLKPEKFNAVSTVIYVWSLNDIGNDLMGTIEQGLQSLLQLSQELIKLPRPPRLIIMTPGAQSSLGHQALQVNHMIGDALIGLLRSVGRENPEWPCYYLDVDANLSIKEIGDALISIAQTTAKEHAFAYYNKLFYTPYLAKANISKHVPHQYDLDATYLISGGLGGIGKEIMQWLLEKGVQHIVIASRRTPEEAALALSSLNGHKKHVQFIQADLSDYNSVRKLITDIEANNPPLKYIFHTAGILQDKLLDEMTWDDFKRVLMAKMHSAWYLHEATKECEINQFVLFSSIAVLGNDGQSNYAFANGFLDGLAAYRQQQGMPAISINWGPWESTGMTEKMSNGRFLASGIVPIDKHAALKALEVCLDTSKSLIVSQFDLPALKQWLHPSQHTLFHEMLKNSMPVEKEKVNSNNESLVADLKNTLCSLLKVSNINPDDNWFEMGMDSILAIQFKKQISKMLNVEIKNSDIYSYPTLALLSQFLSGVSTTNISKVLSAKLCQLLKVKSIKPDDNWFEMGMDSILAIQFKKQIANELKLDIKNSDIYTYPTLLTLTQYLMSLTGQVEKTKPSQVFHTPESILEGGHPLSPQQIEMWQYMATSKEPAAYHIPIMLKTRDIDLSRLQNALDKVIIAIPLLRAAFREEGRKQEQIILHQATCIIDEINLEEKALDQFVLKAFQKPFELNKAPLLRCYLLHKGDDIYLSFVLHHLLSDGVSPIKFLELLSHYYNHPELNTVDIESPNYIDYINWVNTHIDENYETKYVAYWRNKLKGYTYHDLFAPPKQDMAINGHAGARISNKLDKETVIQLMEVSKFNKVNLSCILLAMLYKTIAFFTGKTDIASIVILTGRESPQFENVFGDLSNDIVLRTNIQKKQSIISLAKIIQSEWLEISEYQMVRPQMIIDNGLSLPKISFDFQKFSHLKLKFDERQAELVSAKLKKIYLWGDDPRHLSFKFYLYDDQILTFDLKYRKDKYTAADANKIVKKFLDLLEEFVSKDRKSEKSAG